MGSTLKSFFFNKGGYIVARVLFYPTLLRNVLLEGHGRLWYTRIDRSVLLGALPLRKHTKKLIMEEDVRTVVSMNEPYELRYFCSTKEEWAEEGVKHIQFPVGDFFYAPTQAQLKEAVEEVQACYSNGKTAYVHCKAGRGRSATVVTCYLMKQYGFSPQEAFHRIQQARPHVKLCDAQWDAVYGYYHNSCRD